MIFLTEDEFLPIISKRIQVISREEELVVEKLLPVWQAVALGGILKLVKNRIRYNALMNFLKSRVDQKHLDILSSDLKGYDDVIFSYGESLIGILFPDKKSAIAIALSQKLQCKSSFALKGLTYLSGFLLLQMKRDEEELSDFPAFCEIYLGYKNVFHDLISSDLQKSIIEILLLNDVLKAEDSLIFADSFEESDELDQGIWVKFLNRKLILFISIAMILLSSIVYFTQFRTSESIAISEEEEIIPLDSLTKLSDSLTQVAIDSSKLQSDSTKNLYWTIGKNFWVPKQSSIVQLHTFLTDSTAKEALILPCFEIAFNSENDQLTQTKEYFFKRFTEGFQIFKEVRLEIYAFSEKDSQSALKRGFLLKNRLVGEGLSPKRINVLPISGGISPDASIPLNAQVVFKVIK